MRPSRREFVKWVTASGIALSLSRLAAAAGCRLSRRARCFRDDRAGTPRPMAPGASTASPRSPAPNSMHPISAPRICRDGPATTSHAILVRAPDATHVYTGMDLARLTGALKPSVVVTAEDLVKIGARVPAFYAGDLFCPVGKTPLYMGQPVALLIFESSVRSTGRGWRCATGRSSSQAKRPARRRCPTMARFASPAWRALRLTHPMSIRRSRRAGLRRRRSRTARFRCGRRSPRKPWRPMARLRPMASRSVRSSIAKNPALLMLDRTFETQSVDPMFLEPESGLGWYNGKDGKA